MLVSLNVISVPITYIGAHVFIHLLEVVIVYEKNEISSWYCMSLSVFFFFGLSAFVLHFFVPNKFLMGQFSDGTALFISVVMKFIVTAKAWMLLQ